MNAKFTVDFIEKKIEDFIAEGLKHKRFDNMMDNVYVDAIFLNKISIEHYIFNMICINLYSSL
ncbi:hypothetical protein [Clostridium perfringens]|uniref:hypothetical protein n=1 Tax=Clostridium perfringens TaxID=1502 RepID=UPI0024BCC623|nr:hypothetical protein [Clostridium perfringens]